MRNPSEKESEAAEAHHSPIPYVLVGLALFCLTALTYWLSTQHLGAVGIPIALTIALVKGGLVAYFFMHLNEHGGVNAIIFICAVLFVVILIAGLIADPVFRTEGQRSLRPPPMATEFPGTDAPAPAPSAPSTAH